VNYSLKIISVAILISIIGVFTIYSSTFQEEDLDLRTIFKRQIVWIVLGLLSFLFMSRFQYRRLWDLTYFLYGAMFFLLVLVYITGHISSGAQRWLKIFWLNFQPSEFAKLVIVIFLARYFSYKSVSDTRIPARNFGVAKGLILPLMFVVIPMGLILEQPDLGSASMLFFIFVVMLHLSDMRLKRIIIFLMVIVLLLPVFWLFLRDYQKERLLVFINPNLDPLGAGYTVIQSKIAIGSAGLAGKGWLFGTQSQLHFLPESHTDFIFATFAEQWGFLGSIFLLFLYYILIKYSLDIAARTSDYFGKLLAGGIASIFFGQIFINIFMVMGLAPVVGLPLILMSYGGSSIFITFISLGILVNINRERTVF